MKTWFWAFLIPLIGLPFYTKGRDSFSQLAPDLYVIESRNKQALVVITPDVSDDQIDATGPVRLWRAEMHVRGPDSSITHEVFFRSQHPTRHTVRFLRQGTAFDIILREQKGPGPSSADLTRRWRFQDNEVREWITPNEIRLVIR